MDQPTLDDSIENFDAWNVYLIEVTTEKNCGQMLSEAPGDNAMDGTRGAIGASGSITDFISRGVIYLREGIEINFLKSILLGRTFSSRR